MPSAGPERRPAMLRMLLLAIVLASVSLIAPVAAAPRGTVDIQLLNVSDWHGQLDPLTVGTTQVGGAAVLAAYFQQERAANPNTITITAGDAVGATPPISSFFADTPTIETMRLMGFDVDTLGNHNFDSGLGRLRDQVALAGSTSAAGRPFSYVSANLTNLEAEGLGAIKPYKMFEVGGVKVAVIGITNPEAPSLVFPGSFGSISVTDPIPAANRARAQAQAAGAKVTVLITHSGITGFNPDGSAFGPLIDLANNVGGFDVILGDHTDFQYQGVHNNALVVENKSKGITYARTTLSVDPRNGRIVNRAVTFVTPAASAVTPDPAITALLNGYRAQLGPILSQGVGSATRVVPRSDACGRADGRLCESLIGNLTTDAMRQRYGTDFAITNSGGLRAALTCPTVDSPTDFCPPFTPPPYPITRGQVLTVLPFGNIVVTVSLSGAELKAFLENGVSAMPGANGRFPQVSGLCFSYDISAAAGSRVTGAVRQAADGSCSGAAIDLTAASSYSVATNDFMANGGDGYPNIFGRSTSREIMDQVLADYVAASSPVSPAIQGRIVCTTSGATACPVISAP
jgi:2',3'-cyclic-nucleotide 2'-phosphodiesterase (5'-nucleotidase family)